MNRNGQTTVAAIRQFVDDLLVVPALFDEPPGGYLHWATHMAEIAEMVAKDWGKYVDVVLDKVDLSKIASPKMVGNETISGKLIASTGPAWRYGMILPTVLEGNFEAHVLNACRVGASEDVLETIQGVEAAKELEDLYFLQAQLQQFDVDTTELERVVEAKVSRLHFESGRPLYIGVYHSEERYRTFAPILTCKGQGRYIAGDNRKFKKFRADSHHEALAKAREWFLVVREEEIDQAKKAARAAALEKTPPVVYDTLVSILLKDKRLMDVTGTKLAVENGAHGLYAMQGPDWCYVTSCSAEKAAQMAMVALKEAAAVGDKTSMMVKTSGRMADYLGFNGFSEDQDGNLTWTSKTAPKWVPAHGSAGKGRVLNASHEPIILTKIEKPESERFSHSVSIKIVETDDVITSVVPARWGLTDNDALLWGIRAGLNKCKANSRRAKK